MKNCIILIQGLLALLPQIAAPVTHSFEQAVLVLSGASSIEDLSESEIENYLHFHEHPLDLNFASELRLRSSGLFSELQIASLIRARNDSGCILSYSELSLLSGFGGEITSALREFTVLRSGNPAPGQRNNGAVHGSISVKASARDDFSENLESAMSFGVKVDATVGETAELRWASRTTYSDPRPSIGTVSAAYYGRSFPGKAVIGDFSARFGQGLTQWSGFSIASLGTPASLVKNPSGIAATSGVGSSLCGMAGDCILGRVQLSAGISFKSGFEPMANVCYRLDNASFSITGTRSSAGFDWRIGLPGCTLFGEACWKGGPAAVAGAHWIPGYGQRLVIRLGAYSPQYGRQYSGAVLSWSGPWITAGLDGGWSFASSAPQARALLQLHRPSADEVWLVPGIRLFCRYRPFEAAPLRTEGRVTAEMRMGSCGVNLRVDLTRCRETAWLLYCESYLKAERLTFHARWTLFRIDRWDDRIYVYERDIPWAFTVPAYYGRGEAFSLYGKLSFGRLAGYIRASYTHYP